MALISSEVLPSTGHAASALKITPVSGPKNAAYYTRCLRFVLASFSTDCPEYGGWYDIVGRAMIRVLEHIGTRATWLFDRGFDANDFYIISRKPTRLSTGPSPSTMFLCDCRI